VSYRSGGGLLCDDFGSSVYIALVDAEYFAGYLLEQSLSVDNLFVFILVFRYFKTPPSSQKQVLSYGIATAAVLRLILIVIGADIVEKWKSVLLIFAGILLYSSYNLLVYVNSIFLNAHFSFEKMMMIVLCQTNAERLMTMRKI